MISNRTLVPNPNHRNEYPIAFFWYTKKKGQTIEQIIDTDPSFFEWAVSVFQLVTPSQAMHYTRKTGRKIDPCLIMNAEPYTWQKGDPEQMYMELCEVCDLGSVISKYRIPPEPTLF